MKQIVSLLLIAFISLIACKDKKQTTGTDVVVQKTEDAVQNPANDSTDIRKVITDFYNWYNKLYKIPGLSPVQRN